MYNSKKLNKRITMKILLLMLSLSLSLLASDAFISSTVLKEKLTQDNIVILDITDAITFKAGHIPNAVNVNVFDFRKLRQKK